MALSQEDDPYTDPYTNPYTDSNPRPAGPLVDDGPGTFRSTTWGNEPTFPGNQGPQSRGGSVPIVAGLMGLVHLFGKLFHHGSSTPTPNPTPTPTNTPNTSSTPSTTQQLAGMTPEIIALITALMNKPQDVNANNPALSSLNLAVPQLTQQLNDLLANDVQRRKMSDPLYEAVLRGAMGGLPVWMRNGGLGGLTGGGLSGPVVSPRTGGSGVPSTPATDIFRAQGDDPEGYAFPNTRV